MPDEATFTEILSIQVDPQAFEKSLATLTEAYRKWVASLQEDGAANVAGAGIAQQLSDLAKSMDEFTARTSLAVESFTSAYNAANQRVAEASDEATKKQVDNAHAVAEANAGVTASVQATTEAQERGTEASGAMFGQLLTDIPTAVTQLATLQLEWDAISAVINGVVSVIEAPFKAIADGVKYLRDTEVAAASLVGPLQAGVAFSSDLVENFKQASIAADQVERALQGVAAKSNIPVEQLRDVFKAVLDSGGQNAGKTLQDTIDLATTLALTYKAQGAEAVNNNRLLQQTRQLFEGGLVPSSSLFLQTTGQTVQQYTDMVAEGLKHHDLLQQLPPVLKEITSGLQAQEGTQKSITEQIELQVKQLEGDAVSKFYEDITAELVKLKATIDDASPAIKQFLGVFVDLTEGIAKGILEISRVPGVIEIFKTSLLGVEFVVDGLRGTLVETIAGFTALATISSHPLDLTANNKALEDFAKTAADSKQKTLDLYQVLLNGGTPNGVIDTGDASRRGVPSNPLDSPVAGKPHPIAPKSELADRTEELKQDKLAFQQQLDDIKARYKQFQQDMTEAVSSGAASRRAASNDFNLHLQDQIDAIHQAESEFVSAAHDDSVKVAADPGATADQKKKAQSAINDAITAEVKKGQDAINAILAEGRSLESAADKEEQKERIDAYNKSFDAIKQVLSAQIAAIKQAATEGRLTTVEAIDAETDARKQAHDTELSLIDSALAARNLGALQEQKITEQRSAVETAFNNTEILAAQQRADALYKEQLAKEAFADKSRELTLQQAALTAQLNALEYGDSGYSAAQQQLLTAHELELNALTQEKAAHLEVAMAKNQDSQETRDLAIQLKELFVQQQQAYNSRVQQIRGQVSNPTFQRQLIQDANANEEARLTNAQAQAQQNLTNFETSEHPDMGFAEAEASLKTLQTQLDLTTKALKDFKAGTETSTSDQLKTALEKTFFGPGFFATFDKNQKAIDASTDAHSKHVAELNQAITITTGVSNAFVGLVGIINKVEQGLAQGGILGGAGAAASQAGGILGSLSGIAGIGKAIPVVGSVLSALGPVLSFVGDLFTAQARRIGEQVKKSFQDTVTAFQNGNTDLADTIISLEQQRQSAISQLSGKKGGQDQLNSLLPQFDQEIQSLKNQQKDLITSFETQLSQLQLQDSTLSGIAQQWAAINKQVKDYLSAGGDAVKAAQFLSLQLQQIQESSQQSLDEGNQTAIQDALNLNSLLQQRIDLQTSIKNAADAFNKSQFDLLNADSLERKQAGSVSRGQEIADAQAAYDAQTKSYQDQLDALNQQIDLETKKVDKETTVFNLAKSTADLQADSNALTLKALDDQIAKWNDLKNIISGITLGPDGLFTGSGVTAPVNNNFYITITGSDLTPQQVQDSVTQSFIDAQRQAGN